MQIRPIATLMAAGVLLLQACALAGVSPSTPAPATPPPQASTVHVLYGTDRVPDRHAEGGFGKKRGELQYGAIDVTLPPGHAPGAIEQVAVYRLDVIPDASRHLALAGPPRRMSEAEFVAEARASRDGRAILFVHGYDESFALALYRTAQLAFDLKVDGPVFAFSWPSAASVVDYDYDLDSERYAERDFRAYLDDIVDRAGVKHLTIIAHSMGTKLVVGALDQRADARGAAKCCEHVVLASSDLDAALATRLLPGVIAQSGDVTLYVNDSDIALQASRFLAGRMPRAGELMKDRAPLILDGLVSVDASAARMNLIAFNHEAYVDDPLLLDDLKAIMDGQAPGKRAHLEAKTVKRGTYWVLKP